MWYTKKYDIIVVGAGPAGSTFSRIAAKNGLSVLLLEKKHQIGVPVRCGEGVIESELRLFHGPQPNWVKTTIDKFYFVAPNEQSIIVKLKGRGFILDRKIFDADLAKFAEDEGATVITNAYVNDLLFDGDTVTGVKVIHDGSPIEIRSEIVIGADGVESRIGRFAGIDTKLNINNIDSGYQKTISNINVDESTCAFYVSNELAPGGYIWIFPKSKDSANIGIGINGKASINGGSAKYRLEKFINSKYPEHKVDSIAVGGIPLSKPMDKMVSNGVMLIGDAARTVNPLSGGGIILGMKSASLAAEIATNLLKDRIEPSKVNLMEYQNRWVENEGKQINRIYRIKQAIDKLTDNDLNKIIGKVNKLPAEKQSIARIFRACIPQKPSLLIDVAKVFMGY